MDDGEDEGKAEGEDEDEGEGEGKVAEGEGVGVGEGALGGIRYQIPDSDTKLGRVAFFAKITDT